MKSTNRNKTQQRSLKPQSTILFQLESTTVIVHQVPVNTDDWRIVTQLILASGCGFHLQERETNRISMNFPWDFHEYLLEKYGKMANRKNKSFTDFPFSLGMHPKDNGLRTECVSLGAPFGCQHFTTWALLPVLNRSCHHHSWERIWQGSGAVLHGSQRYNEVYAKNVLAPFIIPLTIILV